MKICSVNKCGREALAKSLCGKHYKRMRKHGTTDAPKRAPGSLEDRFWRFVDKSDDDSCWLWSGGTVGRGYGSIMLPDQSTGTAHRVSYEIHYGEIPDGMNVLHKCDNPPCVNPKHLFLGTHADNSLDMTDKNRQANGESCGLSKLTESDIKYIRESDLTQKELAKEFGVTQANISEIKRGRTWRHVK